MIGFLSRDSDGGGGIKTQTLKNNLLADPADGADKRCIHRRDPRDLRANLFVTDSFYSVLKLFTGFASAALIAW